MWRRSAHHTKKSPLSRIYEILMILKFGDSYCGGLCCALDWRLAEDTIGSMCDAIKDYVCAPVKVNKIIQCIARDCN